MLYWQSACLLSLLTWTSVAYTYARNSDSVSARRATSVSTLRGKITRLVHKIDPRGTLSSAWQSQLGQLVMQHLKRTTVPASAKFHGNDGCSTSTNVLEEKRTEGERRKAKRDNASADYELNLFFAAHIFLYKWEKYFNKQT